MFWNRAASPRLSFVVAWFLFLAVVHGCAAGVKKPLCWREEFSSPYRFTGAQFSRLSETFGNTFKSLKEMETGFHDIGHGLYMLPIQSQDSSQGEKSDPPREDEQAEPSAGD
ncbi:MAG: hypothetical protein HY719_17750 [Planctomycetes bacterium]|nr:hypothetical protein [Planctomycetota bacterium]